MRGVRARSVRCRAKSGCWEGRCAMALLDLGGKGRDGGFGGVEMIRSDTGGLTIRRWMMVWSFFSFFFFFFGVSCFSWKGSL